jgi:hypothetical protein
LGFEAVAIFFDRRANILAVVFLCVLIIVCIGGLWFVGDLTKFQETISLKESQAALRSANDPDQLDQVLKQYPSNRILKLVALANKDWIEIDLAQRGLLNEAEPRDLSKSVDLTAFSRGDLEALDRDLRIAEANAATVEPRYIALIKAERDKIETDARSLALANDTLAKFMAMIDEQHADTRDLLSKALAARLKYYGQYERCIALLLRDFGIYKVENGQFIFPFLSTANSYNSAAAAMAAAARRMADLEGERALLQQSQLNRWKSLVDRN